MRRQGGSASSGVTAVLCNTLVSAKAIGALRMLVCALYSWSTSCRR